MAAEDRSFSDLVQDILRNVQEIVRSEVRLAKTEIGEEAVKARSSAVLLGAGAMTAIYAALVVGAALAVIATVMLATGLKRFKQIHPTPERTVETIKENVEWAKQQTK